MTYAQFLAIFLAIPIAAMLIILRAQVPRRQALTIAALIVVALAYTAPWDNALVLNGVWSFSTRHVIGIVIGVVPLEEYCFYVLQVLLTGLITVYLLRRAGAGRI